MHFDTIAAISTPMGEGAIAIVRLSGDEAVQIANRIFRSPNGKRLIEEKISVVILTVPVGAAQQITDRLVNTEVKGILNFTPARLTVPSHIRVHHIDLAVELQSLVYFLKNYSK